MTNLLKNRWVAITRPAHQAGKLIKKLQDNGANTISFPLLEIIAPQNPTLVRQQLHDLAQFDCAIFISPNAVERALTFVDKTQFQSLKIAAVGKKTAITLRNQGLNVDYFPEKLFNSEALLDLKAMQYVQGQQIVIFRGEGGRDVLRDTLQQRGAKVTYRNVYARHCPVDTIDLLKQHYYQNKLDIIVLTSGESLQHLLRLAKHEKWFANIPLLVGSQRIATKYQHLIASKLWVAPDPSDETIYRYLNRVDFCL